MAEFHMSEKPQECPLCGKTKHMQRPKVLYGHKVCKKCYYSFISRRQCAWVLDHFLIEDLPFLFMMIKFALLKNTTWIILNLYLTVMLLISFCLMIIFLIKDGFGGYSPGKAIAGIRVINNKNGKPIGLWRSFKRNLPLFIPLIIIFMFFELRSGYRTGDRWSQSKVIWNKYASNPIFQANPSVWSEQSKKEQVEKLLLKAVKIETKGEWERAIEIYNKIISDNPGTQIAQDASVSLKSLNERFNNIDS
jgi:uncharacterized RDD family membrane protein YckC